MRLIPAVLMAALTLAPLSAAAEGDPGRGATLYAPCASCHGSNAGGNAALGAPRLTHLTPVYIVAQLDKFRDRLRGGSGATEQAQQMAAMAATLADEQAVYDVAAYIDSLDSEPYPVSVKGDAALGADYYNQYCGACHGREALGNPALNSPPLAGADDWYLVAQLRGFRSGERGADPADRTGRQMRAMALALPEDSAVVDVVAFIRSIQP